MTRRSSSVIWFSFLRSLTGSPIFPMSWTSPARWTCFAGPLQDKAHALGNVSRVDGNRSRVTGRIPISGIKRRNECGGERQVRALELSVRRREAFGEVALRLRGGRRGVARRAPARRKKNQRPRRKLVVSNGQENHDRGVEGDCGQRDRGQSVRAVSSGDAWYLGAKP